MSYNALFQRSSLDRWYKLDENVTSTSIAVDSSGNGYDGTYFGDASNVVGPASYLSQAVYLNGQAGFTKARVELPMSSLVLTAGTYISWYRRQNTTVDSFAAIAAVRGRFTLHSSRSQNEFGFNWTDSSSQWGYSTGVSSILPSWVPVAFTADGVGGMARWYIGGSEVANHTMGGSSDLDGRTFRIGHDAVRSTERFVDAELSNFAFFTEALSLADIQEYGAGPEPLATLAGSLTTNGTDLIIDAGTWDGQSNGSVTRSWDIRNASDDSLYQSGTGDATLSAPPAGDYYMFLRGSNDGGHDSTQDQTTASMTVGGSGPSVSPVHHFYKPLVEVIA
ncbi:MAG: LamG-like jellyroll fold domain-containing protein [Planctomycetota bacterium]